MATIDFWCNFCEDRFQVDEGTGGMVFVRMRRIAGEEMYYKTKHLACGRECRSYVETRVEPTSKKPTKVIDINGDKMRIHGRDRNVYPHDLKDVVERANELYEKGNRDG